MKKRILTVALLALPFLTPAQTMSQKTLEQRVQQIEDRIALKALVDNFSILADKKDVEAQVLLFTADASVETFVGGVSVTRLSGRKAMADAFGAFLKNFETVYHFNGQQTLTLNGDKASGVSYCLVTLIGDEAGKKMKTTIGVYYQDEYAREGGQWLIAKRTSVFDWQDKAELGK